MPSPKLNSQIKSPTSAANAGNPETAPDRGAVATPVAVLLADMEGKVTACNETALRILGTDPSKKLDLALVDVIASQDPAERAELEKKIISAVLKQGRYESSRRCRGEFGAEFTSEVFVTLLRDANTRPTGMIALFSPSQQNSKSPLVGVTARKADDREAARAESRDVDGTALVLASPVMHQFMRMVDRVAGHTESVLITGETGTGKELIAHVIHRSSNRRSRPWVDINCAALPENLVESELFGYEKGAFTGADSSKPGLFELADKGTLFLDEIGELQIQTQVKLLRVLDGYPFYRLGGHRKIIVDVRIVTATNQDLEAAVAAGRFREDLFHRLGQFRLRVPPLRERPEDIVALAEHFLALKTPKGSFAADAISAMLSHSWPGNVRELRNLIARVAVEAREPEIHESQIKGAIFGNPITQRQSPSMPVGNLDSMEEQMIIRALERSGGHRSQAAEQLGISRRTLSRKLKEYNININPGEGANALGSISLEQQKFFRARVQLAVTLRNQQGYETQVQGVNLSTGGMGLDGLNEPMRFTGLLDVSFSLPESDFVFQAKARIVWFGDEGRVGLRFAVIDPALFEQLQQWTNKKMKDEGWELPT
jgi:PAS domain S-box-containing protein